jgi:hypothetical protein
MSCSEVFDDPVKCVDDEFRVVVITGTACGCRVIGPFATYA